MKLTKWYYDLVSDTGQTFIGYGVYLDLFKFKLPWRACFIGNGSLSLKQGMGKFQVSEHDDHFSFAINRYQLSGKWPKSVATEPRQLINNDHLTICWQGLSLNSPAEIVLNNQLIKGLGYVERLDMTFKQTQLPFQELHWGRFISRDGDKLLTWIKFDGSHATTQLFDGDQYYSAAEINQHQVSYANGTLAMQQHAVLLETDISSHVPYWLQKMFGGSMMLGQENKWLSSAILTDAVGLQHQGWVIHEVVTW